MKYLFSIIFAFLSLTVFGGAGDTLWVDAIAGSDANDGSTKALAVQTLTRTQVLLTAMSSGKPIALSDTAYYGTLSFLNKTGTGGNPYKLITWNKYGNGKAKLKGMKQLTGWTSEGSNIYSKVDSDLPSSKYGTVSSLYNDWIYILNGIWIDGVWKGIAQTPDDGYYDMESWAGDGESYITDSDAPFVNGEYNGQGAYIYMGITDWLAEKAEITSNSTTTLYLNTSDIGSYTLWSMHYPSYASVKYKVVNDQPDINGEWKYNYILRKLTIYSTTNPSSLTIYAPINDEVITINNCDYVTIEGIEVWGANLFGINIENTCDEITVENCNVYYPGHSGIFSYQSADVDFISDTVRNGNHSGIYNISGADGSEIYIHNCYVKDLGEYQYYADEEQQYIGIGGVYCESDLDLQYNYVNNTNYNGISFSTSPEYNDGTVITYGNLINNWCQHLNDGGGIYFGNYNDNVSKIIRKNIVLNAGGNDEFDDYDDMINTMGVYLDGLDAASYFTIDSNSIYNAQMPIFLQHTSVHNTIRRNTLVGFTPWGTSLLYAAGLYHRENGSDYLLFDHNLSVATDSISECFMWRYSTPHSSTGTTVDYNFYFNPFRNDDKVVATYEQVGATFTYRTVASMYSALGYEQHSEGNSISYYHYEVVCDDEDFVQVFTNWSGGAHVFDLGNVVLKDTNDVNRSSTLSVNAFSSRVLFYVSGSLGTMDNTFYEGVVEEGEGEPYYGMVGLHTLLINDDNTRTVTMGGVEYYYGVGEIGGATPIPNLADSLISWYSFEGNANDYCDDNDGTVYNAQNVYTGELGQGYCYYFDGDGDYIALPVIPLTGDETGSISVWARASSTGYTYNMIVDRYSQTDCIWITSDGTWAGLLNETTIYYGTAHDNDWHNFVWTYDGTLGSAQAKLYIDGALYATATETDDWLREANVWRVGGNTNGSSSYWWLGYIDSLGFFKHTLSADQVAELYNNGDGVYYGEGEFYNY